MTRSKDISNEITNRYQRAFQDSTEVAEKHWRKFLLLIVGGISILYGYEFIYGENGMRRMAEVREATIQMQNENAVLARQVFDVREQDRLLSTNDFVLEKVVRENLRLARPGEMIYLFEENPANATSTGPVEFDEVTVAKPPPYAEKSAGSH